MIKSLVICIALLAMPIAHASESDEHGTTGTKYSVLAIEYIGASDKPIPAVVMSDSATGAEWYRRTVLQRPKVFTYAHVLNAALLEKLIAEAEAFERAVRPELEKIPESGGTISVTVIRPNKKNTFLYYPESALSQIDGLLKHCKGEKSLRSDLVKFQNRIRP